MNDADAEVQRARVMAAWNRWAGPLGMGWQRKNSFSWLRGEIPGHQGAMMACDARWGYKEADISVNLALVAEVEDDADLEYIVVHEIMHVFLGGLRAGHREKVDSDAYHMLEEHAATSLAQAFLWLRSSVERELEPHVHAEASLT